MIDVYPPYNISKAQCTGVWHHYDINFDNILNGMISLFVLSSLEGWPDYLYEVIDGGSP